MPQHTVAAPLAEWALHQPQRPALRDGQRSLDFATLWHMVQQRAAQLPATLAPHHLLPASASTLDQLLDFLATVVSGRCAALGHPDWPAAVRDTIADTLSQLPAVGAAAAPADRPFYIGFTSGSTGLPKGFRRTHRSWTDSLRICTDTFGPAACGPVLAPGSVAHSLFLFGMVLGLWTGGGVVVQDRFHAGQALATLAQGHATCLVVVPSQVLLMLEWAKHRQLPPIAATQLILISGARWPRQHTPALQALFPSARIVEFYGASETSFITWQDADPRLPLTVVGRPFANVQLRIDQGRIYVRSPMLFMDYVVNAGDQTAAHRAHWDGGQWLTIGDRGHLDEQGRLCLEGREHRMLVSQGKNLFPDELEALLTSHPAIAQASVHGVPDPLRGHAVVAVLQLHADADAAAALNSAALAAWCRQWSEGWKIPRQFLLCTDWPLTASGKTDHPRVATLLRDHAPCLHRLP